jgi:hypothetical protein
MAKPNDKQALLDVGNYEIYNREIVRLVFPRIIAEIKAIKPRTKAGDIVAFYFALLSHIDGNEYRADGTENKRFGVSFPSQDRIYEMTGIDVKRHRVLTRILVENGLIDEPKRICVDMRHYIWYRPLFCASISDDGYVINSDGERVVPDYGRCFS